MSCSEIPFPLCIAGDVNWSKIDFLDMDLDKRKRSPLSANFFKAVDESCPTEKMLCFELWVWPEKKVKYRGLMSQFMYKMYHIVYKE